MGTRWWWSGGGGGQAAMPLYRNFGRIMSKKRPLATKKNWCQNSKIFVEKGVKLSSSILGYPNRNFNLATAVFCFFSIQPEFSVRRRQHMCSRCVFLSLPSPGDVINNSIFDIIATACYKKTNANILDRNI